MVGSAQHMIMAWSTPLMATAPHPTIAHRLARRADMAALTALMDAAIGELQIPFLSPAQIVASRAIMGLDTQLIDDGTYFVVEIDGALAGCGGWSRRATLYGGDEIPGREPRLLDPARDAARIRAMYTAPAFVRRGVARVILARCEAAASDEGFRRVELAATLAGEPLYRACGYAIIERFEEAMAGVPVPLLRMGKLLRYGARAGRDFGATGDRRLAAAARVA
jgi:GNAT superfamily N-acetyltransferase